MLDAWKKMHSLQEQHYATTQQTPDSIAARHIVAPPGFHFTEWGREIPEAEQAYL